MVSPTPSSQASTSVDELLDEDGYGQKVIVQKVDGSIETGEVTYSEKSALQSHPEVTVVEENSPVYISAESWGLDRINQADLPLDGFYDGGSDGQGVRVYVIDTGVNYRLSQFADAQRTGFDAVDGDTWFPAVDPKTFREVAREPHQEGELPFAFVTYERTEPAPKGLPA